MPPPPGWARPPSQASSYGSIDSGVSHPPREGSKRKRRVGSFTWIEFDDFEKDSDESKARKRAREEEADLKKSDDFEKDGDESKARKRARKEEADLKKLFCPFYKRNPQEFEQSRICVGLRWSSVHRVKEHIFRRHGCPKFQCHRCYDEFATETALHDHQRADNPCEKKPVSNRINAQQEKQLRSRRLYQKSLDEEEKWNAVYKIIFPDDEVIPSPCAQNLPTDSDFEILKLPVWPTEVEGIALNSEALELLQSPPPGPLGEWFPGTYEASEIGSKSLEDWFSDTFGHYEEEYGKKAQNQVTPNFPA